MSTYVVPGRVAALALVLSAASIHAQTPFCLPDADGDGHPLFGNPEAMLNPFAPLMGLYIVPVSGAIGDLDGNGDGNGQDFPAFTACFLGPSVTPSGVYCPLFDADQDHNDDLSDLAGFVSDFTGSD